MEKKVNIIDRIVHYLELYIKKILHGEFLIYIIEKIFNDTPISSELKKIIEDFLEEIKTYQSNCEAHKEFPYYFTGDDKLIKDVLIFEKNLLDQKADNNVSLFLIPKSIVEEPNKIAVLKTYTQLYRNSELEEDFFLYAIFMIFHKYIENNDFKSLSWKNLLRFKKIRNIADKNRFINLSSLQKKFIIDQMLAIF